jgi:hypothetical protein
MVRDYKELQKLGEEMEKMPTNTEVQKGGQIPDPIQHDLPYMSKTLKQYGYLQY